jgi:hypothetical protein
MCLRHPNDTVAGVWAVRTPLSVASEKREWIEADAGLPEGHRPLLVTNNINARNAFGQPSHVWLIWLLQEMDDPEGGLRVLRRRSDPEHHALEVRAVSQNEHSDKQHESYSTLRKLRSDNPGTQLAAELAALLSHVDYPPESFRTWWNDAGLGNVCLLGVAARIWEAAQASALSNSEHSGDKNDEIRTHPLQLTASLRQIVGRLPREIAGLVEEAITLIDTKISPSGDMNGKSTRDVLIADLIATKQPKPLSLAERLRAIYNMGEGYRFDALLEAAAALSATERRRNDKLVMLVRWLVTHPGECIGDHPDVLAQAKHALASTPPEGGRG